MEKQTPVEWLKMQLKKPISYNPLDPSSYAKVLDDMFEQAKFMEEQKSLDDYMTGYQKGWTECNEHIKRDIKHLYHKYQID